jgi:hypothetical protein
MESFEFEIPFDEARERKATADQLKHMWKNIFVIAFFILGIAAALIAIELFTHGTLIVNGKLPVGILFMTLFGIVLIVLYFVTKKMAYDRLQKMLVVLKAKGQTTTFINDINFGSRDGFADCTLAWNSFSTITHWKNYLMIYHFGRGSTPICIGVAEIGQENFDSLLAAVKIKIDSIKNEVQ